MSLGPELAVELMHCARLRADNGAYLIDLGIEFSDQEAIYEGTVVLTESVHDTASLLEDVDFKQVSGTGRKQLSSTGSHRKGKRPWLPDEMIRFLRDAIGVDEVAMTSLLGESLSLKEEENAKILAEYEKLRHNLQKQANLIRKVILERWPEALDLELDIDFSRYLDKRR